VPWHVLSPHHLPRWTRPLAQPQSNQMAQVPNKTGAWGLSSTTHREPVGGPPIPPQGVALPPAALGRSASPPRGVGPQATTGSTWGGLRPLPQGSGHLPLPGARGGKLGAHRSGGPTSPSGVSSGGSARDRRLHAAPGERRCPAAELRRATCRPPTAPPHLMDQQGRPAKPGQEPSTASPELRRGDLDETQQGTRPTTRGTQGALGLTGYPA